MTTDTPWTNDQLRRECEAREAFEEARLHEKCSDTIATLERDLAECRAALRKMLDLFDGKLRCADHETDRECLNRVTAETLSAVRAFLAKGEGK